MTPYEDRADRSTRGFVVVVGNGDPGTTAAVNACVSDTSPRWTVVDELPDYRRDLDDEIYEALILAQRLMLDQKAEYLEYELPWYRGPVFRVEYPRRMLYSKSGFVGRAAKRRKGRCLK